jgi:hypothetical protein
MFSDRDSNILITTYLHYEDVISLIKTNKRLRNDFYYLPYKKFKFDNYSDTDTIKTFVNYSSKIEEIIINRYEFFFLLLVKLPNLKKITIEECELNNLGLLELYCNTLREIIINNCLIDYKIIEIFKYPRLKKITIDPDRTDIKNTILERKCNNIIELDKNIIDCCIIEFIN